MSWVNFVSLSTNDQQNVKTFEYLRVFYDFQSNTRYVLELDHGFFYANSYFREENLQGGR